MPRRGNHEGSIYKDKQGRWRGLVSLPSVDGNYKRKYVYGKTRKEVSDKVNELLNQLRTNTYIEPCKVTLYDWLRTWLETYCMNEVRMTTYVNYETYVERHIKDSIGGYPLCSITTLILQQFYNTKSKKGKLDGSGGLSPKTIKNLHNMLHKALNQAVYLDMIPKNPADFVVLPKKKKVEMRYFTVEEQKQLQEAIKGHRLEMLILTALYTGARQGELLGLPWKNVHIDPNGNSYIRITQTLNRVKNPDETAASRTVLQINEPKTAHSVRIIPLLPEIAERLNQHRENQKAYLKSKHLPDIGFVFTSTTGTLIEARDFQRDFKKILTQNGIRVINVHGLRHTFATRSLESGMSVKTLSSILGHANVGFTLDTYAHVTEALKVEEIGELKEFL
ncbi:MAG: site-specific integrase [Oscillospiraceae bacterium]|nr:site-specific integrase [Oscillospiraceae bacterium]